MGKIFCVEFQRFPHKIFYQYMERCAFYLGVEIEELPDLRANKCFSNTPWDTW